MNMKLMSIALMQDTIHGWNRKWWHTQDGTRLDRNKGELISLFHSEIGEASEGVITGNLDDHLHHRLMEEVEMGDTAIRVLDYSAGFGYDIPGTLEDIERLGIVVVFHDFTNKLAQHAQIHLSIANITEGERKNQDSAQIPGRKRAEVSLAITLVLINMYCELHGFDLLTVIEEKCAYNLKRADHSYEARAKDDGKKW